MKRELECPVCLIIPRSAPVYQCPLGHIVCSECIPQLSTCPICSTPYLKPHGRSLIAEKWLETLDRGCRYEVVGCDFSTHQSRGLIDHEASCSFKPSIISQPKSQAREESQVQSVKDWCIGIMPLVYCCCLFIGLFLLIIGLTGIFYVALKSSSVTAPPQEYLNYFNVSLNSTEHTEIPFYECNWCHLFSFCKDCLPSTKVCPKCCVIYLKSPLRNRCAEEFGEEIKKLSEEAEERQALLDDV